jgi:glycosyltransferase involved in cell wall biosynthesis
VRLAISLLALRPGRVGGAETYVRKLLAELPRVAEPGDVLIAVLDRELAGQLETPGWERVIVGRRGRRIVVDRLLEALPPWRARGVEAAFRLARADVVLFPQQSIFPRHVAGRLVVTVGDVQHLFHPGKIPLAERFFRWAVYGRSMERAQELIAISEFTRVTLVERCGIAPEKITTIPHGFEPAGTDGVRPTDRVVGPYLYYPAATFPHKNHAELIRSYATLRRAGSLDAKLVFTGMKTLAWTTSCTSASFRTRRSGESSRGRRRSSSPPATRASGFRSLRRRSSSAKR